MAGLSWRERSACAGKPPEWWFPDKPHEAGPALEVCWSCPVMVQCREYALGLPEVFGVWGGEVFRLKA